MLDLSILNKEQKLAVETTEGPVLVLAGAGSGKTRVLTYRIAYILDAGLAGPYNILAMTFTNKAAGEMKERIRQLAADSSQLMESKSSSKPITENLQWMGTFHSICVKILKIYGHLVGLSPSFTIYDSADQHATVKEAIENLNISIKEFNPKAIHNYISSAKNELIDEETYQTYAQGYFQEVVASVYPEYQNILRDNNAVDFDDLIMLTIKLFDQNPQTLLKFQEDFRYILVDEYQDTNHAQYKLIKMLAAKHRNICCVGDDDQSIYAFRGATIKNILNFEKDYPEATVVKLEQNYRSTKKILEAAYYVISKNKGRKDKKLWTDNSDGNNIVVYEARNEIDESNWIVNLIEQIAKDSSLKDIAILYRTNAQSRNLEESFIRSGLPYQIIGGVRFYERKEIKDLIAYLRIVYNTKDSKSLERIINVPRRGIGTKAHTELKQLAKEKALSPIDTLLSSAEKLSPPLKKFSELLILIKKYASEHNVVDLLNYILDRTGYIKMLEDGTSENEARIENIKELVSVASRFEGMQPEESLEAFLNEVSLLEGEADKVEEINEKVTLMTIHSAKGLEFDYVFVVGMEENLFPHSNSIFDEKELEEERRLAYVAITRAKKQLYLTHAQSRLYFGSSQRNMISRFITDIDQSLIDRMIGGYNNCFDSDYKVQEYEFRNQLDLKVGDKVKHDYFGIGKIIYADTDIIEVDFGSVYGVKELMLEYAKLEKL